MGRKAGPNLEKIKRIRGVLAKTPDGLWVREIARQAGFSRTTASIYLEKHMQNEIENVFVSKNGKIKVVRLKK